jgi:hypothetical protein
MAMFDISAQGNAHERAIDAAVQAAADAELQSAEHFL